MSTDLVQSTDLVRVLIPAGVGAEEADGDPSAVYLVGTLADMERLLPAIDVAAGRRRATSGPLLSQPTTRLAAELLEARAEVAEWRDRHDALLAALGSSGPGTVLALDRRPSRPVPGCEFRECAQTGTHVHARWEAAQARGELDPVHAQHWSAHEWIDFLRAHGISQARALSELRNAAGGRAAVARSRVYGLAAVQGRPEYAQVLLDLVAKKMADVRTAGEPW